MKSWSTTFPCVTPVSVCASFPLLLPLTLARGVCPQTQWPAFMPSIQENLKRVGELARVHNVLFIVRKIAKRFEYHGKHVRGWCSVQCGFAVSLAVRCCCCCFCCCCCRGGVPLQRWDQMRAIIDPIAPSLYQMMDALLPYVAVMCVCPHVCAASDDGVPGSCLTQCSNPSVEAAVLIKLIVKIFWSCTFHNIPAMMQDRTVRGSMCGLLLQPSLTRSITHNARCARCCLLLWGCLSHRRPSHGSGC